MSELVTKTDLQAALGQLDAKLDNLSLRLTVRLGIMLVAGIGVLAKILKVT
jgi:hypothetical protein